jgi:REP element-mobilizing transposase RayT
MSHSFVNIWVHAVWATKDRAHLIHDHTEFRIHQFIAAEFDAIGCPVRIINGMPDHIHCLFLLHAQKTMADVIKQIKGSSAHFINQHDIIPEKFAWQPGYAAFSVSDSSLERVYKHIKNQKSHHRKQSFQEEYTAYLNAIYPTV